jgi:hypothetical protein
MNYKLLSICGLFAAPWLYIGTLVEATNARLSDTWFTGLWGIIYLSGWMCTVIALQSIRATGNNWFGKSILWLLVISLALANLSNIIQIIVQKNKPSWFFYIDLFWPLSNLIMFVAGIAVVRAGILVGWKRYVPLFVGLWLPIALASMKMGYMLSILFGGIYSAIAWTLLAVLVGTLRHFPVVSIATVEEVYQ